MGLRPAFAALAFAAIAAGARPKAKATPSTDCNVVATYEDGRTEQRDCYVLGAADMVPGTRAVFESCTA